MTSQPEQRSGSSLLRRPPVAVAAFSFALGMLVLLSPVWTDIPRDGQTGDANGRFTRLCGPTIVQAFATAGPRLDDRDRSGDRDSVLDCAATARGRVGVGVLLLLLSVPAGVAALLTERRES